MSTIELRAIRLFVTLRMLVYRTDKFDEHEPRRFGACYEDGRPGFGDVFCAELLVVEN